MTYRVTHYERYTIEPITKTYDSLGALKERYSAFPDVIERFVEELEVGERVVFPYDLMYIELEVERIK